MLRLRAEEQRYLVTASGPEEALVRRIPASRHVASLGALSLPRQPGSLLALDRLFGPEGWEHSADLAIEVAEARSRQAGRAQHPATVTLIGQELSVECMFGDKELVKLVPGYRWSAPQRRWFLPSAPMALDLLSEHFGPLLQVEEAAKRLIELKRIDEETALARAKALPVAAAPDPPAEPLPPVREESLPQTSVAGAETGPLLDRLDRLATAVEQLVETLRSSSPQQAQPPSVTPEPEPPEAAEPAPSDWRELVALLDNDAAEVLQRAQRSAQTALPEQEPAYRTVAGLAMARLGDYANALTALRRTLERPGAIDEDLAREAAAAYTTAVLALLQSECGPEGPLASESDFRDRLLDELVNDNGFDDEQIGSAAARSRLDYLVNDPVLRRIAPALSDYTRMAHLLGFARGGQWMAANRITDILREQTLGDEGFALALILLANALHGEKCVNDWDKAWPHTDVAETLEDLSWLVEEAERRLKSPSIESVMAEPAALSVLACIAGGPVDWASNSQRKALVQLVSLRNPRRREYAEFLAAFQPAAAGQKSVLTLFPGWTKVLAQVRLSRSASYLMDVAANDNGGSGSLTWALAEHVYLGALDLWGLDNPQAELVDLLDLLEGGQRPDNYLNAAARLVEDAGRPWTERVSGEQRKTLYRRALEASLRHRHNRDTLEAFDRLVRELRDEGAAGREEILSTCVRLRTAMRAVRGPALEVLLDAQLESGLPFEDTAEELLSLRGEHDDAAFALSGSFHLFPQFQAWLEARRPEGATFSRTPDGVPGFRVLIVGGHKWLQHRVKPVLDKEWQLKVTWMGPDEAERGTDVLAKARNADLVVINAACIGHSASGRVADAANSAGVPIVTHHLRGAGTLLARLAYDLRSRAPAA